MESPATALTPVSYSHSKPLLRPPPRLHASGEASYGHTLHKYGIYLRDVHFIHQIF